MPTKNSIAVASSFSIQKVSRHHFLIRGDAGIKSYMEFCDLKWSSTYQGWIVHEDDEVDFIQMHMEVLDHLQECKKKKAKAKAPKKKAAAAAAAAAAEAK